MASIENADNLTIETIYKMVLEMKAKLNFLESETHVPQSDKAGLYMEGIDSRLSNVENEIVDIKAVIADMKAEMTVMKAEMAIMKTDIENIKLRLNKVEADIADMKTDMAIMKTDIVNIKADIAIMKAEHSKFRDDIYKWGIALAVGIVVSVSSIVSTVVIFVV